MFHHLTDVTLDGFPNSILHHQIFSFWKTQQPQVCRAPWQYLRWNCKCCPKSRTQMCLMMFDAWLLARPCNILWKQYSLSKNEFNIVKACWRQVMRERAIREARSMPRVTRSSDSIRLNQNVPVNPFWRSSTISIFQICYSNLPIHLQLNQLRVQPQTASKPKVAARVEFVRTNFAAKRKAPKGCDCKSCCNCRKRNMMEKMAAPGLDGLVWRNYSLCSSEDHKLKNMFSLFIMAL